MVPGKTLFPPGVRVKASLVIFVISDSVGAWGFSLTSE
jgi:hypothetical protein